MGMVASPCLGVEVRELVGVVGRQAGQDARPQPRQDAADPQERRSAVELVEVRPGAVAGRTGKSTSPLIVCNMRIKIGARC
jgi:hypothetical protein